MAKNKNIRIRYLRWGAVAATIIVVAALFTSCSVIRDSQLPMGRYLYRGEGGPVDRVNLAPAGDSIIIYPADGGKQPVWPPLRSEKSELLRNSLDMNVLWIAAKFRPGTENLPQTLNTELNINFSVGWRWDRYKRMARQSWKNQSLSLGVLGGIGTTKISPSTTNHRTTLEYHAPVAGFGTVLLTSFNTFSYGLAVGTDYLLESDRSIWIYQRKVWYGLTLGIKIN